VALLFARHVTGVLVVIIIKTLDLLLQIASSAQSFWHSETSPLA
jgi:hypothetical protein